MHAAVGRRWTLGLAFTSFVSIGLPTAALGVAWPTLRIDLGRPLGDLGVLLVVVTVGFALVALTHGALLSVLSPGGALALSGVLYCLGTLGLAVPSWPIVLVGALLLGAAAGELESGLNGHVASAHGTRAMNLMHAAFGVGATVGPLVVTELVDADISPRVLFVGVAVVGLVLSVGFAATRASWVSAPRPVTPPVELSPERRAGPTQGERAPTPVGRVLLVATLVVFLAYVGLETATGQWSYTLLTGGRGLDDRTAGWVVSGFWAALTLGRLAIGAAGRRITAARVLDLSVPTALVAVLLVALGGSALGAAAVVLSGLCFAGIFPALVSLTPGRFGDRTASVMGWQLAAGSAGVGLGPMLVGIGVEASGAEAVGGGLVGLAVVMVAAHVVVRRHLPSVSAAAPGVATAG